MDGEWPIRRLGDVIELKRGYDLPSSNRVAGEIPVISSSGMSGTHTSAMAKAPGVVTGRYGTLGEVHFVQKDYWPLNTTLYVRDFKGSEPRFVAYFLKTIEFFAYSDKAAVPGLNRNDLHGAEVHWPPVRDQAAIAEVLGALDDKIELNRRMTETLEAMARALFKSWFVDFDPVRAKAERRSTGLPKALETHFPDAFLDGGTPQGWSTCPLSEMAKLDRTTCEPSTLGDEVVEYFSIPAFDAARSPVRELASSIKSLKLHVVAPVVLFSKLNPEASRVWPVLSQSVDPMLASTEFLALRPEADRVSLFFLVSLLKSAAFRARAAGMVTGTSKSHQRVQPKALMQLECLMPPPPIQRAFDEVVEPMMLRIDILLRQSNTLAALRDTLLPKLISGELRIEDAAAEVTAA